MNRINKITQLKKAGLFVLAFCGALAFTPPKGFRITGNITGGMEGMKVYLQYADIQEPKHLDSATLHNGHFVFAGKTISPRYYTITFKDTGKEKRDFEYKNINLFVENADIMVQAPYDSLRSVLDGWYGKGTSSALTIKGSASEDFFLKYNKDKEPFDKQHSDLFNDYIKFLNPDSGAVKQPRSVGMDLCDRMDIVDSARKAYVLQFLKDNKPNEILAYIATKALTLGNITTTDIGWMEQLFTPVTDKGFLTKKFLEDAASYKKIAVGSHFVDFTMKDTSGNTHALSEYIGKGKYVLLECWASWCGPCRADIPHLKEIYELYHPQGFEIISLSLDDKKNNWTNAIDQEKMKWLQLSDLQAFKGGIPQTYHINGIPHCLLFDPQGNLVTENMRGSWMDKRLIAMYGNQFPSDYSYLCRLTGTLKGMKDTVISIYYRQNSVAKTDTINVRDGRFVWAAEIPEPQRVEVALAHRYMSFFVESGSIYLTATAGGDSLIVKGSTAQDEAEAFTKSIKPITDQEEALYPKYGKGTKEEQIALEHQLDELRKQRRAKANEYIAAHPSSPFSVSLVSDRAMMGEYNDVNNIYQKLDKSAQQTDQGRRIAERLELLKKSSIGSTMLNFTQNDTKGKPVQFSSFKGKYVLVDFWASWCGPCRGENPNVLKAYNQYKNKNFTVVGISLDDKADKWEKAIQEDHMPWTELSDLKGWKNELADYYGIQGIPSNLLVDPNGKIIAKDLRGEALHAKLAEVLN